MSVLAESLTMADLLKQLGDIPPHRVHMRPAPGTATESDVIAVEAGGRALCELVEGILVEKAMGYMEARIAALLCYFLEDYLEQHDLGIVAGADGMMRLARGLVRIPDVSFIAWKRLPNRKVPQEPIAGLAPDLAIEVFSRGNTEKEMARKVEEYFRAGSQRVWIVYPAKRFAEDYTSIQDRTRVSERQSLKGGDLLPGFSLSLRKLFSRAEGRRG
jgi:Uma2 family endonuclease